MSDPQRYTLALPEISYGMDESNKGEYVLWRDYKRLQAEVDEYKKVVSTAHVDLFAENARLKAEVERLTKAHSDALADFWAIHKGYFDLKAEVERLRKAGDDLFEFAKTADTLAHKELKKALNAWNAAKEGRPNE